MFNLIPYLSVIENITLACKFSPVRNRRALEKSSTLEEEALRLLSHLQLKDPDLVRKPVLELSVGQQQRVATARALIGAPELLIADEPTSALDADSRDRFLELLLRECENSQTTVLFVSHDGSLETNFDRALDLRAINHASVPHHQGRSRMNLALLLKLTLKSMLNRRFTASLTIASICISVLLLLAVETVRVEAKNSFTNTVSGTDLLVGARSGSVQLLLYSVFRIGNATNNIDWKSYEEIAGHPAVDWAIPLSLGDSYKGFRVLGTNRSYFENYRYADDQALSFKHGEEFKQVYDAVVGADVAQELGLALGDELTLAHGIHDTKFARHEDKPFTLVGVLSKTGTPVDRTIHVSLEGIEALHVDWKSGTRSRQKISAEQALAMDLQPKQITAFMLGLKSKMAVFKLQRGINNYRKEPLLAILPGLALGELWQLVGVAEKALLIVAIFVLVNGFVCLLTVILTSLNERRREIAILRSLGCRPSQVFTLLTMESLLFTVLGCAAGVALFYLSIWLTQPVLQQILGLHIPLRPLQLPQQLYLLAILSASLLIGSIPGYRAYRYSLSDGMSIKM